jgi:hypothetical protein
MKNIFQDLYLYLSDQGWVSGKYGLMAHCFTKICPRWILNPQLYQLTSLEELSIKISIF